MIATVWARNRRERMEADVVGRRTSRANKVAGKRLKAAEGFMRAHDSERFYEEVLKAMWGYLSDKLNMPASQLTRQNIVATLDARGVPAEVSGKVIKVLDDCEMARYTPDSSSETSVDALFRQATETINDMEKSRIAKK